MKVDILGTEYMIEFRSEDDDKGLIENDGYTDTSAKLMVVDDGEKSKNDPLRKKDFKAYQNQILRHEIIHAFLAESGLDGSGCGVVHWECNEEMVDWFAIQGQKIHRAWKQAGCLD